MSSSSSLIVFFAEYLIYVFPIIFFWLLHQSDRLTIFRSVTSGGLAAIASQFIKHFFYLPRPFITLQHSPLVNFRLDGSLPSSHTAIAFALSFAIYSRRPRLGLLLISLSVLIALGRIASSVHSLTDVLVGVLLALLAHRISLRAFPH